MFASAVPDGPISDEEDADAPTSGCDDSDSDDSDSDDCVAAFASRSYNTRIPVGDQWSAGDDEPLCDDLCDDVGDAGDMVVAAVGAIRW